LDRAWGGKSEGRAARKQPPGGRTHPVLENTSKKKVKKGAWDGGTGSKQKNLKKFESKKGKNYPGEENNFVFKSQKAMKEKREKKGWFRRPQISRSKRGRSPHPPKLSLSPKKTRTWVWGKKRRHKGTPRGRHRNGGDSSLWFGKADGRESGGEDLHKKKRGPPYV